MIIAGCRISKIVIVQSLEPHEVKTGKILFEYISAQIGVYHLDVPVEILDCSNSPDFLRILDGLKASAISSGEIPLLHVECHGSPEDGLEFENGSTLTWSDLAVALQSLNLSCRFNLLAIFSACFGGYFLNQMGVINPAPCWCMIAPTDTVNPGEIMQGFRAFYSALFYNFDVGKALSVLNKIPLTDGCWFGQSAELWFEKTLICYIEKHCTRSAIREQVKNICQQRPNYGRKQSSSSLKQILRQVNSQSLLHDFFDRYFMVSELPENRQRFNTTKVRLKLRISELRKSGKIIL